jgi:hypothetical protein
MNNARKGKTSSSKYGRRFGRIVELICTSGPANENLVQMAAGKARKLPSQTGWPEPDLICGTHRMRDEIE